ncbi:HEAT repeat domain-containing protein [Dactylosporangium sp. NPDC048998]|uniref:HEAT repeat domain-containing protein n=1 Tax=Dactylosporangium sp. NPDC048998 TaxID=3363976 RepID=UPI0037226258
MIATVVDDDSAAAGIRKEGRAVTRFMIDRRLARRRPVPELERGLVQDLEDAGIVISDVWDLVNTTERYPAAIPILMAWLNRVDELPSDDARERLREGLIRSLSTRDARPVAGPLMVRQFRTVSLDPVRWAVGNAIAIVADSTVFADVVDLVREPSYGTARQMPVDALPRIGGRANRSTVIEILVDLLSDDDVVLHAISAVRRIRAANARPALERLLDHERDTIRRRAQQALGRLP